MIRHGLAQDIPENQTETINVKSLKIKKKEIRINHRPNHIVSSNSTIENNSISLEFLR